MVSSGRGFTAHNHKIFSMKINIGVIFDVFTKFLDHKNLEHTVCICIEWKMYKHVYALMSICRHCMEAPIWKEFFELWVLFSVGSLTYALKIQPTNCKTAVGSKATTHTVANCVSQLFFIAVFIQIYFCGLDLRKKRRRSPTMLVMMGSSYHTRQDR